MTRPKNSGDCLILEILHEKDELIKLALCEKKNLVARALNIPEQDYDTVAEVCLQLSSFSSSYLEPKEVQQHMMTIS